MEVLLLWQALSFNTITWTIKQKKKKKKKIKEKKKKKKKKKKNDGINRFAQINSLVSGVH